MTSEREDDGGKPEPANDNRPPDGQDAASEADASERLDRVVLTIARLIGRQIARDHFRALQAANDNQPIRRAGAKEDRCEEDEDS